MTCAGRPFAVVSAVQMKPELEGEPVPKTPIVFNLFPRYFSEISGWTAELPRIAGMGFDHVFVNPFHLTGFSGSLYAVKDYYSLNKHLWHDIRDDGDFAPLESFVTESGRQGLRVVMDLVINHTAKDSVLVDRHPAWFRHDRNGRIESPFAVDPDDASKKTVWGDLARIDHESSSDREGLWKYFDDVVGFYQKKNIVCFRCDAAYQVSSEFWTFIIERAKTRRPDTLFFAETLGCSPGQVRKLCGTGFDYLFNSSKWWHFDQPWCLEQHELFGRTAPSISFPENHDTRRLTREGPGTEDFQRGRYVLAAVFSEGLLMPMGYEYGACTKMDVVGGTPKHMNDPRRWDLSGWIASLHRLKRSVPVLGEEGHWQALTAYDTECFVMEKSSDSGHGPALACINKTDAVQTLDFRTPDSGAQKEYAAAVYPCRDPEARQAVPERLTLKPHEIVLLMT